MGRWQNRVRQALYRPKKSGMMANFAMEALVKLGKDLNEGVERALAEGKKKE